MLMPRESPMPSLPPKNHAGEQLHARAAARAELRMPAELPNRHAGAQNIPGLPGGHALYREAFAQFQRKFMIRALREANGNQSEAARRAGIHRNTVHRIVKGIK